MLLLSVPVWSSDGTINITGSVTAGTCVVTGSGTGSNKSISVSLPPVQTSALTSSGEVAARTPFTINITGCGSGVTKATTYFEPGATVDVATGNLLLQGASSATLVEIQLLNGSGSSSGGAAFSPIVLGAGQASQNSGTYTLASGSATLHYYAQYYATGASTAGTANSSVQFTMLYQ
ncbi:fimbrial protein [Frateuria aurantia]